jgi:hypothetical protein
MSPQGLKNLVKYRPTLLAYYARLAVSTGSIILEGEALQTAKNIPASSSSDLKSCDYQISGIMHLFLSIRAFAPLCHHGEYLAFGTDK